MRVNQRKAGAILTYVSMGLGYLISMAYTPLMLRLLGKSEYGLYNLVASIVAYLGILNFGFGSAYMRYYSRYKVQDDREKIATLNGMFLIIFSVLGFVAVLAGSVLAFNSDIIFGSKLTVDELAKAKILMFVLVVNLGISFPNIVFTSHITANERFVFQKVVQMIKLVINPFVVIPVLIMGYGSVGMVIITTGLNILIEAANFTYCIKKLKMTFCFRSFDKVLMREMSVFSSFIFLNMIIDQINWNVDKYVLGRFHGTETVAVYGVAAQLNTYYLSISTAISSVFIPQVHKMVVERNDNKELTSLFTRIGRLQFMFLSFIFTLLIFFGRPFISLWAGKDYVGAFPIAMLLIIPVTIPLIQNIGIEIQRAKNMHQFRSWVYLFIALGNLALTIPLAKRYGGVGAAVGTAVSLIIGNGVLMNWYYRAKVGLDMAHFWCQILRFVPAFIIPVIMGLACMSFDLYQIRYLLLFGALFSIVFSGSMWVFGMNPYERDLFVRPVQKILGLITLRGKKR